MSFDTSWDVNKYRMIHDTEKQWQWRRAFLIKNKNKYHENRLVDLARKFIKVKFFNWKYPEQTMGLLNNLSDGLVVDWRDDSDDAAATQAKRFCRSTSINNLQSDMKNVEVISPYHSDYILPGFIVLLGITDDPFEILERSCTFSQMEEPSFKFYSSQSDNVVKATLYIQNTQIASSFGSSRTNAQQNVSKDAYYKLKRFCFVIKIKEDKIPMNKINVYVEINFPHSDDSISPQNCTALISTTDAIAILHLIKYETKLNNDNIGMKLLKMMGWEDGTGLGKSGQGRLDPIEPVKLPRHVGLGYLSSNNNKESVYKVSDLEQLESVLKNDIQMQITNFITSPARVLSFAEECTTNERRLIHIVCKELGLITRSYGLYKKRYVVVFKKEDSRKLFEKLINNGFEDDYYKLISPKKLK